jgi:hypothetical protein
MAAGYVGDEELLGQGKKTPKGNNPVAPPVYGDDVISKRGTPLVPSGGQQAKLLNEQIPADYLGKPGFAAVPRDVFDTTAANPPQQIREIPKTPTWMENARAEESQQSTEMFEAPKKPEALNIMEGPKGLPTPLPLEKRKMSNMDNARQAALWRKPREDGVGKAVNFARDVGAGFAAKSKDMVNSAATAVYDPVERFVTELVTGEETKATDYRRPGLLQDQSKPVGGGTAGGETPQQKLDRLVAEEEAAAAATDSTQPQGVKRLADAEGNTTGFTDGSPAFNVSPEKVEENQGVLNGLMRSRGELEGQERGALPRREALPAAGVAAQQAERGGGVFIPKPITMQEAIVDYASGRVGSQGYSMLRNLDISARNGSKAAKMILLSLKGMKHGEQGASPAEVLAVAKAQEQKRANAASEGMEQAKFARDLNNDEYNRNKDQKEYELDAMQTAKELDEYAATEPERVLEQQEKVAEIGFKNEEYARSFDSLKNAPDGAYAQIYSRLYRMTGNAADAQAHFNHFIKDGKTPDGKPLNGKTILEAFDAQYGGGQ